MDPLTALITIVGLLANFKQERNAGKVQKDETFRQWLDNHRHQSVMSLLRDNKVLAEQLERVAANQSAEIMAGFTSLSEAVAKVLSRLDDFQGIQQSMTPDIQLSEQATAILDRFEELEAEMLQIDDRQIIFALPDGTGSGASVPDPRFLVDDIATLTDLGFIRLSGCSNYGDEQYRLTRSGSAYARQLRTIK